MTILMVTRTRLYAAIEYIIVCYRYCMIHIWIQVSRFMTPCYVVNYLQVDTVLLVYSRRL